MSARVSGWSKYDWPALCNFVQFGHATMSKNILQLCPKSSCKKQTTEDFPSGTDATVNEGWLDLKVCNETDNTFQIEINFDNNYMHGRILSQDVMSTEYLIYNSFVTYKKRDKEIYQIASVCCSETDKNTCRKTERELYINQCRIAYRLPDYIKIEESGV